MVLSKKSVPLRYCIFRGSLAIDIKSDQLLVPEKPHKKNQFLFLEKHVKTSHKKKVQHKSKV